MPYASTNTGWRWVDDATQLLTGETFSTTIPPIAPSSVSPAQQLTNLLTAGLIITGTTTPSISGTYSCSVTAQNDLAAMYNLIQRSGGATFPGGLTALAWPVLNSRQPVLFTTVSDFLAVETAIGNYVLKIKQALLLNQSLPSNQISI